MTECKCDCGKECAPSCDMCGQCIFDYYGIDNYLTPPEPTEAV